MNKTAMAKTTCLVHKRFSDERYNMKGDEHLSTLKTEENV